MQEQPAAPRTCDNKTHRSSASRADLETDAMGITMGRAGSMLSRAAAVLTVAAGLTALTAPTVGCNNFFVCQGKSSCPSSGSGGSGGSGGTGTTGAGDYVYVSNSSTGPNYVTGYQIGSASLTQLPGMPYALGYQPGEMAVSKSNSYLYIVAPSGSSSPGIFRYAIASDGSLSGGTNVASGQLIGAMTLSPDGNWMYTADPAGLYLTQYQVNSDGSLLQPGVTFSLSGAGCIFAPTATAVAPNCAIAVAPTGNYVAVAMNTQGTYIFPYSSSGGISQAVQSGYIQSPSGSSGDFALAFDNSNYLYIDRTAQFSSYGSLGQPSPSSVKNYTGYSSLNSVGPVPRAVAMSADYSDVFTADEGTSRIYGFSLSNGSMTLLSGLPLSGPTYVAALGVERSGTYLLAAGYNGTGGLQMYTITSTGLTPVASESTGTTTSVPVTMALTH